MKKTQAQAQIFKISTWNSNVPVLLEWNSISSKTHNLEEKLKLKFGNLYFQLGEIEGAMDVKVSWMNNYHTLILPPHP